jgi:hypothetical protein
MLLLEREKMINHLKAMFCAEAQAIDRRQIHQEIVIQIRIVLEECSHRNYGWGLDDGSIVSQVGMNFNKAVRKSFPELGKSDAIFGHGLEFLP